MMRTGVGVVLGACVAACAAAAAGAQAVTAVPKLDLKKFTGVWYEVALLPDKKQKNCVADAVLLFSEKNKPRQFELVKSCLMKNGFSDVQNYDGKQDKQEDGRLKLVYLYFLSHKVWVLGFDPEYQWALVGTPNHKNLYVISKTRKMPEAAFAEAKAKAAAQGFDLTKLMTMPQKRLTVSPSGTPLNAASGGAAKPKP